MFGTLVIIHELPDLDRFFDSLKTVFRFDPNIKSHRQVRVRIPCREATTTDIENHVHAEYRQLVHPAGSDARQLKVFNDRLFVNVIEVHADEVQDKQCWYFKAWTPGAEDCYWVAGYIKPLRPRCPDFGAFVFWDYQSHPDSKSAREMFDVVL